MLHNYAISVSRWRTQAVLSPDPTGISYTGLFFPERNSCLMIPGKRWGSDGPILSPVYCRRFDKNKSVQKIIQQQYRLVASVSYLFTEL
jgi:NAD/NADP transhydrogenase beta subunit